MSEPSKDNQHPDNNTGSPSRVYGCPQRLLTLGRCPIVFFLDVYYNIMSIPTTRYVGICSVPLSRALVSGDRQSITHTTGMTLTLPVWTSKDTLHPSQQPMFTLARLWLSMTYIKYIMKCVLINK